MKNTTVEASASKIQSYLYASLRLLELQSAWIAIVPSTSAKVCLGMSIGYAGERIRALSDRLSQILTSEAPAVAVIYAEFLNGAVGYTQFEDIAAFSYAVLSDMMSAMTSYCDNAHRICDAPTVRILEQLIRDLESDCQNFLSSIGRLSPAFAVDMDGELTFYSGNEPLPELVAMPSRGNGVEILPDKRPTTHRCDQDLLQREHLVAFLHFVLLDVELGAAECCARNIVQYRDMPMSFKCDMCRQIWDEVRHARVIKSAMEKLGGQEGQFSVPMRTWSRYILGQTLPERLAMEQVLQEGNAVEANASFIALLLNSDEADLVSLARDLQFVNADESVHAAIGNRWLSYLVNEDEFIGMVEAMAARIGLTIPGYVPFNPSLRKACGFSQRFINHFSA
jgi:uncharacterized ferritin-like protein (DUF455 family)